MNDLLRSKLPSGPSLHRTGLTDTFPVLESSREIASTGTGSLSPGYPTFMRGLILSQNRSRGGSRKGKYVPYAPDVYGSLSGSPYIAVGRSPVMDTVAQGTSSVKVALDHAARYVTGDDLVICQKGGGTENLGPVTDINITGGPWCILTATFPASEDFTTTKKAFVRVNTGWCSALIANVAAGAKTCEVPTSSVDPEIVSIGKPLVLVDTDTAAEAVGIIKDITLGDTTTQITFETACTGTFTTVNSAMVYIGGCRHADGVLLDEADPGSGAGGNGGMGGICFGRGDILVGSIGNLDHAAVKDLCAKIRHGRFIF